MAKPNKRQKAIIELFSIIEGEGLHYGVVTYGVSEQVEVIKDKELAKLVEKFKEVTADLEAKIEELAEEVQPFLEDDSDF